MSYVLRHHPPPGMDASGWVPLTDLKAVLKTRPSDAEIESVIATCKKRRFDRGVALDGQPAVRAVQGHSFELDAPVLEPVTDPSQVLLAVHVTSKDAWAAIQQDGHLRKMGRSHVHFATAPNHLRRNSWVAVCLRLDLVAALAAGHKFWLATNSVLLAEDPLPMGFVEEVRLADMRWPTSQQTC